MRSGTRNRSLLLTVFTVIYSSALLGDEYLIGYRLATQNSTLISDRITVSKSMTPCFGEKIETLYLPRNSNQNLQTLLKTYEDDFIEFASQQSISLEKLY